MAVLTACSAAAAVRFARIRYPVVSQTYTQASPLAVRRRPRGLDPESRRLKHKVHGNSRLHAFAPAASFLLSSGSSRAPSPLLRRDCAMRSATTTAAGREAAAEASEDPVEAETALFEVGRHAADLADPKP